MFAVMRTTLLKYYLLKRPKIFGSYKYLVYLLHNQIIVSLPPSSLEVFKQDRKVFRKEKVDKVKGVKMTWWVIKNAVVIILQRFLISPRESDGCGSCRRVR